MPKRTSRAARPRWRITRGREIAIGPGKANLLEAIDREGSISGGARCLGMSYRRAWLLVATMNRCFSRPLVSTAGRHGWRGRGAALTPSGRKALELYRRIEARSTVAARSSLSALLRMLR